MNHEKQPTHVSAIVFLLVLVVAGCFTMGTVDAHRHERDPNTTSHIQSTPSPGSTGVDNPKPGTPEYGWLQFISFLQQQEQLPVSSPAPDGDPDWAGTWETKKQLQLDKSGDSSCPDIVKGVLNDPGHLPASSSALVSSSGELPVQLKSMTPAPLTDACAGVIQTVLYNEKASRFIAGKTPGHSQNLSDDPILLAMLSSKTAIGFPSGSVLVKALWEPLQTGAILPGTIRVWDAGASYFLNPNNNGFSNMAIGSQNGWPTRVKIDTSSSDSCSSNNYLIKGDVGAPADAPYVPIVPISCFVHTPISSQTYVLIGLNIAHKTDNGWYWVTFAWTNFLPNAKTSVSTPGNPSDPSVGLTNATRPQLLSDWNHYVMNMTDTPSDPTGKKICFNPYVEGQRTGGTVSNCVRCHQFATYVDIKHPPAGGPGGQPMKAGQSLKYGSNPTTMSDTFVKQYLSGTLPTDFVWSLVTNVEPET